MYVSGEYSELGQALNDLQYFYKNIATNHFPNGYQIIQFNHFCLLPINQLNQISMNIITSLNVISNQRFTL